MTVETQPSDLQPAEQSQPQLLSYAHRRFYFVINTKSGNYFKWLVQLRIGEFLTTEGVSGEVHYLRDTATLQTRLEAAHSAGYRDFVAVGGDGTIALVASLLRHHESRIGIVPVGTTNMLAQMLGIPLSTKRSLELLLGPNRVRAIDAFEIGDRLFFLNASAGFSSFSISALRTEEKTYFKLLAYAFTLLRGMRKVKTWRFRLEVDGSPIDLEAAELFVDNVGALWLPRLRMSDARFDDGEAVICYVPKATMPELANAFLDVLLVRKKRLSLRFLTSAQRLNVDCDERIPVQADGDAIGYTPVTIAVAPAITEFIVPQPHPALPMPATQQILPLA